MVKVTAKIPEGLLEVIKNESERTGVGVQAIAGQLMQHGYLDLRERQRSASAQKADLSEQVDHKASEDKSMEASGAPDKKRLEENAASEQAEGVTNVHSDD